MAAVNRMSVEKEYAKNKELDKADIAALKEWMSKQPHLPEIDELDLIIFLHSCHWSVEMAKHTIDLYFTIRTHVPEFFTQKDPTNSLVSHTMTVVNFFTLTNAGFNDEILFYGALKNKDYTVFNFAEALKYFMNVCDVLLQQHGTANGFQIVINVDGVNLGHLARLGVLTMKKFLTYLQDAMPVRIAGIHFIHPVSIMDKILGLIKPFLNPEVSKVLFVHTTMDAFYKHVRRERMPKDLGGENSTIAELEMECHKNIIANRDYIVSEEKLRVIEAARPGKARNAGELFGVEGSFKKLDID